MKHSNMKKVAKIALTALMSLTLITTTIAQGQKTLNSWCNKGEDYYYGLNGVAKDYKQAVYWYRKAAEQGHAGSQHNLGNIFYLDIVS